MIAGMGEVSWRHQCQAMSINVKTVDLFICRLVVLLLPIPGLDFGEVMARVFLKKC